MSWQHSRRGSYHEAFSGYLLLLYSIFRLPEHRSTSGSVRETTGVDTRHHLVMLAKGVPIRHPGIQPIELCAKCRGPVVIEERHLTYVESHGMHESTSVVRDVHVDYLAVLCRKCRPRESCERTVVELATFIN
jgi:hypothetical protein